MHDPSRYEFNKLFPTRLLSVFIPKLIKAMSWSFTEGNILDFGCGPGGTAAKYFWPLVESTNSQMYSVDVSSKMVEFARTNFPHSRTHYGLGSIPDNFPFPKITFDKVFAINVFHLINDIKPILHGIMNVLKPGGQLGFTSSTIHFATFKINATLANSLLWAKYIKVEDYKKIAPEWTDYGTLEPEKYFEKFFEDTRFEKVQFDFAKSYIVHDVPMDDFLEFALSVNPCIDKVPAELLGPLKEEYRRLYTTMKGIPLNSAIIQVEVDYMYCVLQKPLEEAVLNNLNECEWERAQQKG